MNDTPDILKKIISHKEQVVAARKQKISMESIREMAHDSPPCRGFVNNIRKYLGNGKPAVIAEIKKASPSRGIIKENFSADEIAISYANAGAACLSVLTETEFFQGTDEHLQTARSACELPVLRKDFMIEPYQIHESRVIGADCILLIVSALTDTQLEEFSGIAMELDMDILVEVHDREELERGLRLRTPLIGINNRNLHTFKTDINITLGLLTDVFHDRTVVTESGIQTIGDVQLMRKNNVDAFLVGETFMDAPDPGEKLKELFGTDLA